LGFIPPKEPSSQWGSTTHLIRIFELPVMNTRAASVSLCRYCQHYLPEGRRGGTCQQLNVEVESQWQACGLSAPPFSPSWDHLRDIMLWQEKALKMQEVNALGPDAQPEPVAEQIADSINTQIRSVVAPSPISVDNGFNPGSRWVG
jgi:hypothetical protein